MRVICCQLDIAWEAKQANFDRVAGLLSRWGATRGSLLVLPELFATGFSMDVEKIHESDGGPTTQFLVKLARDLECCVVGGVVKKGPDGRGRNQCLVIAPDGKTLAQYDKIHPFSLGGETTQYTAGEKLSFCEWGGFSVSPFICYDLRFPEIFRAAAGRGAELFTVIANWPIKREHHWITLLKARAMENQAYVIGVNRAGTDPGYVYSGRSLIVDPHGQVLRDAGEAEGVIACDIDPQVVRDWRRDFPALRDKHWRE